MTELDKRLAEKQRVLEKMRKQEAELMKQKKAAEDELKELRAKSMNEVASAAMKKVSSKGEAILDYYPLENDKIHGISYDNLEYMFKESDNEVPYMTNIILYKKSIGDSLGKMRYNVDDLDEAAFVEVRILVRKEDIQ